MAQWLSICLPCRPPTNVARVRFPDSASCGLSLLLVLVLAPRGFSPGTPVFPSPQKPTFPNSNSIGNPRATSLLVYDYYVPPSLNKDYFLFIYFIFFQFIIRPSLVSTNPNKVKCKILNNCCINTQKT